MRRFGLFGMVVIAIAAVGFIYWDDIDMQYGYTPSINKVKTGTTTLAREQAYDVWGHTISPAQAMKLQATEQGRRMLSSENGAIAITPELLQLGRTTFYEETFNNEDFLTDVMGVIDGPLQITNLTKAIMELKGQGTTNLRVELAEDFTAGGKTYKKGEKIDTGLDVPKGAMMPLGMPISLEDGRPKAGITCAACHATVDRETGMVIEGAPNDDLNAGMLLALGTNSASYFTHTDLGNLRAYMDKLRPVTTTEGQTAYLPDPKKLEQAVDDVFVKWPRGTFDSSTDLKSNPTSNPDSFTKGGHPYGWSGFAMAGPFKGLSVLNNNVHSQNSDTLVQAEVSQQLFNLDKEVYMGIILQNAANPKYRYDPKSGEQPSKFFQRVDPTPGVLGMNEVIEPPNFPKVTLMAPDTMFLSSPGYKLGEQVNALSAWQNSLVPPKPATKIAAEPLGEDVFTRAGCIKCHAGEAYTNNRIIPANVIKTEPSRASAFKKTEKVFGPAMFYTLDTPVPIPQDAKTVKVPSDFIDPEQVKLAYAQGNSPGGYKVKGLIGLAVSAPYLHDSGVAVGKDINTQLGVANTVNKNIPVDPANSLRAMVDRDLRTKVIASNQADPDLRYVHVTGQGHEFWVDEKAGFTKAEQDALVRYLMYLERRPAAGGNDTDVKKNGRK
ncbi:electron transport protein [Brevibacillus dissolubilis]|uniref:electron transport protein n=1 Tax=Brevibacillus dissolubilis TaxID=1844116 RepID=UPI00111679BC|nr:electron transport protein [Brevibacillus dissolubilis]